MSRHPTAPTAVVWTPELAHPCRSVDHPAVDWVGSAARPAAVAGTNPPRLGRNEFARSAHCRSSGVRSGLTLVDVSIEQPQVTSGEGAVLRALSDVPRRPHIPAMVICLSRFDGIREAVCAAVEVETDADVLDMSGSSEDAQ